MSFSITGLLPRRYLMLITAILALLTLWPLLLFTHPGMTDYPNHLARAFILLNPDDPFLAQNYRIAWGIMPNLGFDLWMVSLGRLLDIDSAGRLYVGLTALATLAGTFAFARALHGRVSVMQLFALPLTFTTGFAFGFLGFNLAMAAMLFALAIWEAIGEERPVLRFATGTILAAGLYLLHFAAFGAFGLYILGARLQTLQTYRSQERLGSWLRALALDGAQAIPAALLFIAQRQVPSESGKVFELIDGFEPPWIRIGQIERLQDLGNLWLNAGMLGLLNSLLLVVWLTGRVRISPRVVPGVLIGVALFFCLPDSIAGTHYVSWRVLLASSLFLVAGAVPTERFNRASAYAVSLGLGVAVSVASTATALSWAHTERARGDLLAATQDIDRGSRILFLQSDLLNRQQKRTRIGMYHLGAYAVLEHRALIQSIFAEPGQQPLRFRDPVVQVVLGSSSNRIENIRKDEAIARLAPRYSDHFDYVLGFGAADIGQLEPIAQHPMRLVRRVGESWLYRLIPDDPQNATEKASPR